jgi:mono/diheme cytochrome c family protein
MRGLIQLTLIGICAGASAQIPAKGLNDLKSFFAANCVRCHGPDGSARSVEGEKLRGFDFTDAKQLTKQTDADMVRTIRKGLFFGMTMPAFKDQLTEADAQLLVKEILRKAEKGKVIAPVEEPPR